MKDHFYYFGNGNISLYRLAIDQFSGSEGLLRHLNLVKEMGFNTVSFQLFNDVKLPVEVLKQFAAKAKELGLVPIAEIEVNWVADDAVVKSLHPAWVGSPQDVAPGLLPFKYQDIVVRQEILEQYWQPRLEILIKECGLLGLRFEHLYGICPELRQQLYSLSRDLMDRYQHLPAVICEDFGVTDTFLAQHGDKLKVTGIAGPNYIIDTPNFAETTQLKSELLFRKTDGTPRTQRGGCIHTVETNLFERLPEEPEEFARQRLCIELATQRFTAAGGWEFYDHELNWSRDEKVIRFMAQINQLANTMMFVNSEGFSVQELQLPQYPDLLIFTRRHEPCLESKSIQKAQTEVTLVNVNLEIPFHFDKKVLHEIACAYQQVMTHKKRLGWDESYLAVSNARVRVADGIIISPEMDAQRNRTVFTRAPKAKFFKSMEQYEAEREQQMSALYGDPIKTLFNAKWLAEAKQQQGVYERLQKEEAEAKALAAKQVVDAQTSPIVEKGFFSPTSSPVVSVSELMKRLELRQATSEQAAQEAMAASPRKV